MLTLSAPFLVMTPLRSLRRTTASASGSWGTLVRLRSSGVISGQPSAEVDLVPARHGGAASPAVTATRRIPRRIGKEFRRRDRVAGRGQALSTAVPPSGDGVLWGSSMGGILP